MIMDVPLTIVALLLNKSLILVEIPKLVSINLLVTIW